MPNTRFPMPDAPKNGLDLLRWILFEPELVGKFSTELTKKDSIKWVARSCTWIFLISWVLWITVILSIVIFDIPSLFPQLYKSDFITGWQNASNILSRAYIIVINHSLKAFIIIAISSIYLTIFDSSGLSSSIPTIMIICIAGSLAIPGTVGISYQILYPIIWGIPFGLIGGVTRVFLDGLPIFIIFSAVFGIKFSLISYLCIRVLTIIPFLRHFQSIDIFKNIDDLVNKDNTIKSVIEFLQDRKLNEYRRWKSTNRILEDVAVSLVHSLFLGIIGGITHNITFGIVIGMTVGLSWLIGHNFIFYPIYYFTGITTIITFENNPYRKYGSIALPINPVDTILFQLAKQQPQIAFDFVNFLLEYRVRQKKMAIQLLHVAMSEIWFRQAVSLNADALVSPSIPKEYKKLQPSETWIIQLDRLRAQLITSQKQTQIGLKTDAFEIFLTLLHDFRTQTLHESRGWNQGYLEAIDKWIECSNEELASLKIQAETLEPITRNIYRSGEALRPETDQSIFLGRNDLKETFSFEILTARQMPMFLIQGQRRVGKTSLLNFLPDLLGPRFKIVYLDLQGLGERTATGWLKAIHKAVERISSTDFQRLQNSESLEWTPPEDWLSAWGELRDYLEQVSIGKDYKLILAFDEYEILHDDILSKDPDRARHLLGALRSFSQHQNQVVFLWVGARYFSELQNPNWNEFFVQVKHLQVDYLKQPDTLQLIQHPAQDFNLIYPEDVANRIFDLTQGHPALVQQICSEIVNRANRNNRKHITHEDLNDVLDMLILFRENLTIQIFWTQFCTPQDRATVKQILAGQAPNDPVSRYRLIQHGYIVQAGDAWTIRVPLFESWLRTFIETFPA